MTRGLTSLSAGVVISLFLFWLMQFLISQNQQTFKKASSLQMTEFVRLKRDSKVETRDRIIPEPPKPKKQPPPSPPMQTRQSQVQQEPLPDMAMPNLDIPLDTRNLSGNLMAGINVGKQAAVGKPGKINSGLIPLVRIEPRYPLRAQRRRIQGWVKLEFTITENGSVKDAVVVASAPSEIFNRNALKAITRWKFKPKLVNGKPVRQRAVQVMDFKLRR